MHFLFHLFDLSIWFIIWLLGKTFNKSNGGIKESIDFGDTGKTVSDFGGSGSVNVPLAGKGGERGIMSNDKKSLGESKNDLTRFDFDRTIDSEGEMLGGRDVPMSQVRTHFCVEKNVIFSSFSCNFYIIA